MLVDPNTELPNDPGTLRRPVEQRTCTTTTSACISDTLSGLDSVLRTVKAGLPEADCPPEEERTRALERMASLIAKVEAIAPLEPGERILCASYVAGTRSSIGAALIAVSDRRLLHAPRSAFHSRGAWRAERLDEIRVGSRTRRSLGLAAAYQFEIVGVDGSGLAFELESRKDARTFADALGRRLVDGTEPDDRRDPSASSMSDFSSPKRPNRRPGTSGPSSVRGT